jgi:hypothetical protein
VLPFFFGILSRSLAICSDCVMLVHRLVCGETRGNPSVDKNSS